MKKNSSHLKKSAARRRQRQLGRCVLGASLVAAGLPAFAAEKATPESLYEGGEDAGANWVEFSAGDLLTTGNAAQAQQRVRANDGPFGGVEDLHYSTTVAKKTTLTIDGRAIAENNDYKLHLDLEKDGVGYLKFNYDSFRTWYADNGGYSPANGLNLANPGNALALDRGTFSFAAGYLPEGRPNYTFKYTHTFREGDDSAAPWGATPGSVLLQNPGVMQVNEKSDAFEFGVTDHIKKTDLGLGVTVQTGSLNDANLLNFPQGITGTSQRVTDQQDVSYDMESVHAYTQTWLKENLFLSSGFMFANLDDSFTGSRVYGDDFDVAYSPSYPADYYGYYNLYGQAHQQQYVMNLNLMAMPTKTFSITPSLRVQKQDTTADSAETGDWYDYLAASSDTQNFANSSGYDSLEVRERLEACYTGLTNWVFTATSDLTEGQGTLNEAGGLTETIGAPDGQLPVLLRTDDTRFFQKYALSARWYPTKYASVDVGGYYKDNRYNYDDTYDSTPNNAGPYNSLYPGFLLYQGFRTWDGNTRLTLHPFTQVTLVSRYEYQLANIATEPAPASGLNEVDTSQMHSHIFGQNLSWTPLNWLSLQAGANYVISETKTPASQYTEAILNDQNNYWTVNGNVGIVLDDKTELNLGYYFYRAADNQSAVAGNGLPLGADEQEHSASATLTRHITKNLRVNLKYAWTHYTDYATAGHDNFDAQVVYTSLQYRF